MTDPVNLNHLIHTQTSKSASTIAKEKNTTPDCAHVFSHFNFYSEHPKKHQVFMDILSIFANSSATEAVISNLTTHLLQTYPVAEIGAIVCPEAEGFLLGPLMALRLRVPCIVARKPRKLPNDVIRQKYSKWSGADEFEMQKGAFEGLDMNGRDGKKKGAVIVDDCVGSGGSSGAVMRLCQRLGVPVLEGCYIFNTSVKAQEESRRKNLKALPVYGMFLIDEEVFGSMEQVSGKKDEHGEHSGDQSVP